MTALAIYRFAQVFAVVGVLLWLGRILVDRWHARIDTTSLSSRGAVVCLPSREPSAATSLPGGGDDSEIAA